DPRPKEQALMTFSVTWKPLALASAGLAATGVLASSPARADSTPVGPLPSGPITTTTTRPGLLVAVAPPHASSASGPASRVARPPLRRACRQAGLRGGRGHERRARLQGRRTRADLDRLRADARRRVLEGGEVRDLQGPVRLGADR